MKIEGREKSSAQNRIERTKPKRYNRWGALPGIWEFVDSNKNWNTVNLTEQDFIAVCFGKDNSKGNPIKVVLKKKTELNNRLFYLPLF